jgi:tetratricopeptide (TPR) repeat protein
MNPAYKAFLSYSHKDEAFARWLHRELEAWKVPRDLVGRATPKGTVPRTLRPVFRDRDDFAGGPSLKDATLAALQASEFLVVICSPHSAASQYVNEEVRLFKAMGRADRVIPVIVAGEPGSAQDECFPAAVKYKLDDAGAIGREPAEPIAADARESGDGRPRALAKVVAGLLGVAFDEITRRAEQARRRRVALAAGVGTGAFVFATAFASYALYESYRAGVAIDRSVFAIAGIIGRTDDIGASADPEALRSDMLRTQCDLMQGLARGRRAPGPLPETICQNEQARAVFQIGEKKAAMDGVAAWLARVRSDFASASPPSRDLAVATVKAAIELLLMRDAAQDPLRHDALRDAVGVAAEAGRAVASDAYLRGIHDELLWKHLAQLEARKDWAASRAAMEAAAGLRAEQVRAMGEGEAGYAAAVDRGVYLRRIGWVLLRHLNDRDGALRSAREAVGLFSGLTPPAPDGVRFAHQSALAQEVLGDALLATGRKADAAASYRAALEHCNRALRANPLPDDETRQTLRKEIAYLQRQLGIALQ